VAPTQCRAARAFIAMSQSDLARAAVVPVALVTDFETRILTLRPPDLDAIQHALLDRRREMTKTGAYPGFEWSARCRHEQCPASPGWWAGKLTK
jgi:hypothetical protein